MADINITLGSGIGPQGPVGPSGTGVISVNTFTGAINIAGAGGASISTVTAASGATITINASGVGGNVSSVNGLTGTVVLSSVSVSAASAVHSHSTADITSFAAAAASAAPVQSVQGRTGAVSLVVGDITAAAAVHSHSTADITGFASAASGAAPVQSVQGRTGAVSLVVADITAAAAVHSHSTSDVTSFRAAAAAAAPVSSVNGLTGTVVINAASVTAAAASHQHAASDITSGTLPMGRLALPSDSDLRALSSNGSVVTPNGLMRAVGNIAIRPWTSIIASAGGGTFGGYYLSHTGLNVGTTSTSYSELLGAGAYDYGAFGAGDGVTTNTDWSLPMSLWVRFSHPNNGISDFADGQRVRVLMCAPATLGTAAPALRCVGWEFQRNGTAGSLFLFAHNGTTLTSVSALSGLNRFPFGILRLRTDGLGNAYLDGTISNTPVSASVTGAPTGTVTQDFAIKASYYNTLATPSGGTMWFSTPWLVS